MSTLVRNVLATVLSFCAVYGLSRSIRESDWYLLSLPLGLLIVGGLIIHRPTLGAQVLARAVWWANLALGSVLAITGHGRELTGGGMLALACGAALLVAGRRTLGEANTKGRIVPGALRGMLLLLMIFALADAQTFLLFGTIGLIKESNRLGFSIVMTVFGALYVAGFVGLYRLEIWGAMLNIGVSGAVLATVLLTNVVEKGELATFLTILAAVHLVVATPVVLATLRGKELPGLSPAVRGAVTTIVILLLMAASGLSLAKVR